MLFKKNLKYKRTQLTCFWNANWRLDNGKILLHTKLYGTKIVERFKLSDAIQ